MSEAKLGLAIDSGQAKTAVVDLDALSVAAAKLDSAAEKMAASFKRATPAATDFSKQIVQGMASVGAAQLAALQANERLVAGMSAGSVRVSQAIGQTSYMTKQLSFQLFDIAQTIPLAFDSPRYALLGLATQTGQVIQLYQGQGGLKQAFKDTTDVAKNLGTAIVAGLATPAGLAVAGLVAAGAAAAAAFTVIQSRLPNVDHAIATHRDAIEKIRAAWKEAEKGSAAYGASTLATMQFVANQNRIEQQRLLDRQIKETVGPLASVEDQFGFTSTQRALKQFQPEIDKYLESVRRGRPDVEALGHAIDMKANIDPTNRSLQDAAKALHSVIDGARDTSQRLRELRGEFAHMVTPGPMTPQMPTQNDSLLEILNQRAEMERVRRGLDADLIAIRAKSPSEIGAATLAQGEAAATGHDALERMRIQTAATLAAAQAQFQLTEAERQRKAALDASLESARLELDIVGKSVGEQERLRQQTQLLQQAKQAAADAGTVVSADEIARIKQAADALGALAQKVAEAQVQRDLLFEREQMFRSETEQRVADTLRNLYGDDYKSHFDDATAAMIRFNDHLSEARDLTKDFAATFVSDLQEGKGVLVALSDAVQGLESKLIQMAMDKAIDSLFASLLGSFGGALSPGASSAVAGQAWLNANGNAFAGGNVIPFRRGGIIDRPTLFPMARGAGLMGEAGPEAVMPLKRGPSGRLGVEMHGGGASFGSGTINVNVTGARGNAEIEDMVHEGVVGALAAYDKRLPGRVTGIAAKSVRPRMYERGG